MRIDRLDLIAFGPFTDRSLDFTVDRRKLQIVFGANEAGKSTTLRALEGLLFGIEQRTGDAHLHPYDKLRVGGVLEGGSGDRLEIVRRKGRVATLRDAAGEPVEEIVLKRLLHGVDAETFESLYGLDHDSLRLGAEALERAQGKVGESLFDAGLGGLGVAKIIAELTEEADSLYTPLGRKKPVKEALAAYSEAAREGMQATQARAVHEQERGIEDARATARDAEAERKELHAEQARLSRLARALPHLARLRQLHDERALLGEVRILPDEAESEREAALSALATAQARIDRLGGELERLVAQRSASGLPADFADAGGDVEQLVADANLVEAALRETDAHERALADAERRLLVLAPRVEGLDVRLDRSSVSSRAAKLALDLEQIVSRRRQHESRHAELVARKAGLERTRASSCASFDASMLVALLDEASAAGDIEGEAAREKADADASRLRSSAALAGLGLFHGDALGLAKLPVPVIDVFEREFAGRAERRRELELELPRAEKRERERERELSALLGTGSLATEADLELARRERDEAFERLAKGKPSRASFDDLQRRIHVSDAVADRLRREAARVERHAQLGAARDEAAAEKRRLEDELAAVAAEEVAGLASWRQVWSACAIEPLDPPAMKAWLERRRLVIELFAAAETSRQRASLLDTTAERLAMELSSVTSAARASLGASTPANEAIVPGARPRLTAAIAAGRAVLAEIERARAGEARVGAELLDVDAALGRMGADARSLTEEEDVARRAWLELAAGLGLVPSASLETVLARAAHIVEAAELLASADRARAALDKSRAASVALEASIASLLQRFPGLRVLVEPHATAVERARAIARLSATSRTERIESLHREENVQARRESLAEERSRADEAEAKLEALSLGAGVPRHELAAAESRSREAIAIDRRIAETRHTILTACEGASVAELEAERVAFGSGEIGSALDDLAEKIADAEARRDRAHADAGGREIGLRSMQRDATGAEHALDAESHLSTAAALLRRHAIARIAREILEREVERYRESHQAPIVQRASELLRKLTLGRYDKLAVVYGEGDVPELRCVRGDDEVGIEGLSDGTRDQLYLALRLATIERHTALGEPMPLVLDDIFVHFDDDRTRAGLEVLAELAARMQVILFTHHARVVDLAKLVSPAATIHSL